MLGGFAVLSAFVSLVFFDRMAKRRTEEAETLEFWAMIKKEWNVEQ